MIGSGPSQLALAVSQANQEAAYSDSYVAQAGHLALASVVDFGTAVYNSVDLFDMVEDAETDYVLEGMGANSTAAFYQDNKDLVNAVSFIGGVFVPGGLAVKGSQMLRAGLKGSHFLSPRSTKGALREAYRMVREGKRGTESFRNFKMSTMRNAVAQGLVDNAAAEVAVLGTLNAHPLMEDYMEDLPTNFAASMAFGSALSGVIDIASTANKLKTVSGRAIDASHKPVLEAIRAQPSSVGEGTAFKLHDQTVTELKRIVENESYTLETRKFAKAVMLNSEEAGRRAAQNVASGTGATLEDAEFLSHVEGVLRKPESFGVEKLSFFNAKGTDKPGPLQRLASLFSTKEDGTTTARGVYSPEFGMYLDEGSAARLASAADAGETTQSIQREATRLYKRGAYKTPLSQADNLDVGLAAEVDRDYLIKLAMYDKASLKELKAAKISSDDLPSLHAFAARVRRGQNKLRQLEDDLAEAVAEDKGKKVAELTKNRDTLKADLDNLNVQLVGSRVSPKQLKDAGISEDHITRVTASMDGMSSIVDDVSDRLGGVLSRWFRGERGVDGAMRTELANLLRTGRTEFAPVRELLSSKHANSVRERLAGVADKDGFVYLSANPTRRLGGGYEIETYSLAAQGGNRLKPIHVSNIIGAYRRDDGNMHLLAVNSTADSVREPLRKMQVDADGQIITTDITITADTVADEVLGATAEFVMQQNRGALDGGKGFEELARRANIPVDKVKTIVGMPDTKALKEAGEFTPNYSDAKAMDEYLSSTKRMLVAEDGGNLDSYYSYIKLLESNQDRRLLDQWATETMIDTLVTSEGKSSIVHNLLNAYGGSTEEGLKGLRANKALLVRALGLVNDELAGTRFITSSDMYSRRMGDAGRIANHLSERVTHGINETTNAMLTQYNQHISRIGQSDAQTVVFNTALQVHRTIGEGFIKFQDGVFYNRMSAKEPWKEVMWKGEVFQVPSSMTSVRGAFDELQRASDELYEASIVRAKMTGATIPHNKGLWVPNFDLRSKHVVFLTTPHGEERIITANSTGELEDLMKAVSDHYQGKATFVTPRERAHYNLMMGRAEDGQLREADAALERKGKLGNELPSATLEDARAVAQGIADRIYSSSRAIHSMMFDDAVQVLKQQESYAKAMIDGQGVNKVRKLTGDPVSAATVMQNTLLASRNVLSEDNYKIWHTTNSAFESILTAGLNKWNKLSEGFELKSGRASHKLEHLQKELEEAGIPYPYAAFENSDPYKLFHKEAKPADARRIIAAGNGLAATMALRFLELAQPLVNALSLPIMSYSAAAHKYDSSFLGFRKVGNADFPMRYMMDGVRAMHDTQYNGIFKAAEDAGYFKSIVSEATEAVKMSRIREKGMLAQAEKLLEGVDNFLGGKTVAASDYSEAVVRKVAFSTGVQLGKRLYGMKEGVDDAALLIFARNYMDRAIGNYSANQRPVMFHGTAGAAIGLFQTYMVTFAQNMYRHVERKDFKALAGVMLTQGGLFGTASLPGYDMVSKYIGEHYSENHTDLTTGLYRAVDDPIASAVLYGLPSNLGGLAGLEGGGPNFSSRGAIDPRFPILNGDPPAAASVVMESIKALTNIAGRVASADSVGDAPTAFLEAVSMQSVSRPIARLAELGSGASVTRAGHTVQTPEEVYTPLGVLSRLLAVRSTDEVKLRDAVHLNTYYGSKDRENRSEAMLRIRTAIRQGDLTQEVMDSVALEYFNNGGTATGFRSALNNAMQAESSSMTVTLAQELQPNSPLVNMIMDI